MLLNCQWSGEWGMFMNWYVGNEVNRWTFWEVVCGTLHLNGLWFFRGVVDWNFSMKWSEEFHIQNWSRETFIKRSVGHFTWSGSKMKFAILVQGWWGRKGADCENRMFFSFLLTYNAYLVGIFPTETKRARWLRRGKFRLRLVDSGARTPEAAHSPQSSSVHPSHPILQRKTARSPRHVCN